jgi:hypothetical protein
LNYLLEHATIQKPPNESSRKYHKQFLTQLSLMYVNFSPSNCVFVPCSAMKEGTTTSGEHLPPEFISTHPSHDRRISQFDEWLPLAMKSYERDDFGDTLSTRQDKHGTSSCSRNCGSFQTRRKSQLPFDDRSPKTRVIL